MKKILFCIPNLMDGGAEKVLVNLANNLDSLKYEITILTITDRGINKKKLNSNIIYKSIFKRHFRGSTYLLKILPPNYIFNKYIKGEYDIVISYLEGAAARIVSTSNNTKTKKICWIHTELCEDKALIQGFRSKKEAINCYKKFDKIICVSKEVEIAFKNITQITNQTEVLYNTNETEDIKKSSKEMVKDIEFNSNVFKLCSVGKIIESKGFDRLARIHKKLLEDGINNKIYILGQGKEQENIYRYLKENKLENTFIFLGYKENPYKYIEKCDLYVCASKKEGFSTAITEALIIGKPVITTDCSGMKELLGANNESGIITQNNEDSLYKAIKDILNNPKKIKYYSEQAINRGNKFSKKNTVIAVENMLDKISF